MDVCTGIIASKNLSHSSLILRNLFSTLQVGGSPPHACQQVEAQDVHLRASGLHDALSITLRNGQTQTVMFVRTIPLSFLAERADTSATLWVAMYPPGDPRDSSFDPAPPRPDTPQVHLQLCCSTAPGSLGLGLGSPAAARASVGSRRPSTSPHPEGRRTVDAPLGSARSGAGSVSISSERDQDAAMERYEDIRNQIHNFSNQQRQFRSAEKQLQEVSQEMDSLRQQIETAEEQLNVLAQQRVRAERDKTDATEACEKARETLRRRDLSIKEVRNIRDKADRQLAQLMEDREKNRSSMDVDMRRFDDEVRGLQVDLERRRTEAAALTEGMQRCDRRILELREAAGPGAGGSSSGGAELRALRQQLGAADEELERVKAAAADHSDQVGRTEQQLASDRAALFAAESSAEEARKALKQREAYADGELQKSMKLRVMADDTERELVTQASRAAQLDGQVSENRNQVKDLEERVREVQEEAHRHEASRLELSAAAAQLREHLTREELQSDHALDMSVMLDTKVQQIKAQIQRHHDEAAVKEAEVKQREDALGRKRDELEANAKVLEKVLRSTGDEAGRLREANARFERETNMLEAQATERQKELEDAEHRAASAERELTELGGMREKRERQRQEAEDRLKELGPVLRQAEDRLMVLVEESNQAKSSSEAELQERHRREAALQDQLRALEADLPNIRAAKDSVQEARFQTEEKLNQQRAMLPDRHNQAAQLAAESDRLHVEKEAAQVRIKEAREAAEEQSKAVAALQEALTEQRKRLASASGGAEAEAAREAGIRSEKERARAEAEARSSAARSELQGAEQRQQEVAAELERVRSSHARVADEGREVDQAVDEAKAQLAELRAEGEKLRKETAERLEEAEAARAKAEAEEAEQEQEAKDLEERLAEAAAAAALLAEEREALEATLTARRRAAEGLASDLERTSSEAAGEAVRQSGVASRATDAKARAEALQERVAGLRSKLAPAEAAARQTRTLREEHTAAAEAQLRAKEDRARMIAQREVDIDSTRNAIQDSTETSPAKRKNVELDRCIEKIDELEKEVMQLGTKVETAGDERIELQGRAGEATVNDEQLKANIAQQLMRVGQLQQEQLHSHGCRVSWEARISETACRLQPAEAETERCRVRAQELAQQHASVASEAQSLAAAAESRRRAVQVEEELQTQRRGQAALRLAEATAQHQQALAKRDSSRRAVEEAKRRQEQLSDTHAQLISDIAQQAAHLEDNQVQTLEDNYSDEQLQAEERKVELLQGQLENLTESQAKAKMEVHFLEGVKEQLSAELRQLREEMHAVADKLAHQVEDNNLQGSAMEQLEEEIQRVEVETETLTLQLHEADLENDVLQKEHELLNLQVDGRYQGSVQDFATEVHYVRVAAEEERNSQELEHWKKVAQDAEQDLVGAVAILRQQHDQVEGPLQARLQELVSEHERKAKDLEQRFPEVSGSVHSVPAPLHGLVEPARPLQPGAGKRKALVIGCNYSKSHAPLTGCTNDAWNVQCLLRHSLRYAEDQVLVLLDCSDRCPTPSSRHPTKDNILAGLRWLVKGTAPGDSIAIFFSGYATQQPLLGPEGLHQGCLVPMDFADDLPAGCLDKKGQAGKTDEALANCGASYRLVHMAELTATLRQLPARCKATVLLDCCYGAAPSLSNSDAVPHAFPRSQLDVHPSDVLELQGGKVSTRPWRPRLLELPPLRTPPPSSGGGLPECKCHFFAACRQEQWCAELPIEGCVQGAFTWAFVKAFTMGHLDTTVHKHMNSLRSILGNLRTHFRWLDQTPTLQLSGSADMHDPLL